MTLKAGAHIDWKRLLTMLCIALVSALSIAPTHASEYGAIPANEIVLVIDGHVVHDHAAPEDHHRGQPEHDGSESHSHHCGGAHTASIPAGDVRVASPRTASAIIVAHNSPWAIAGPVYGLERPPRLVA